MGLFENLKSKIDNILKNAPSEIEYTHSQSVLKWVIKLKPDADDALKIAALGHDIDRSFPEKRINSKDYKNYLEYKKAHSLKSAKIIEELMKGKGFSEKIIKKTKNLIENHEIGGKGDVEILKEADSLSFFENNLETYAKNEPLHLKNKIIFMYSRLSNKAKKLVLEIKFHNDSLKKIVIKTISEIN